MITKNYQIARVEAETVENPKEVFVAPYSLEGGIEKIELEGCDVAEWIEKHLNSKPLEAIFLGTAEKRQVWSISSKQLKIFLKTRFTGNYALYVKVSGVALRVRPIKSEELTELTK